jgi:pyruvate/2-oxoglutarate dehydrogenase complex dihydrolipoamide acyltransferase (E2) component
MAFSFFGLRRNTEFHAPLSLTPWRKVAIGTWRTAGDPSVYATMDIDSGPAMAYIGRVRRERGAKATLTQFTGRALAEAIRRHPEINCVLRFGRLYPRKSIDMFFQVASDGAGKDLSGTVIRGIDRLSLEEIAATMDAKVKSIRAHGDPDFKQMKGLMGILPGFIVGTMMDLASFILTGLNLWHPLLGTPRDAFGSAMITGIGSLGIDNAFAPLVPYSRVPLLIAVGAVKDTPVVKDGKVEIAPVVRMSVTFDHRIIDGVHAAKMARVFKAVFANPERELGALPAPAERVTEST